VSLNNSVIKDFSIYAAYHSVHYVLDWLFV